MEYVFICLAVFLFLGFVIGGEVVRQERKKKKFIASLYENFGVLRQKEYSLDRFARMDSFLRRHPQKGQIDDITWNDLDMDDVFKSMNATLCASGEEYLYYKLRTPVLEEGEREHFDQLVGFFGEKADTRVKIQCMLNNLGYTGKYSLYDYLENLNFLGEGSNKKHYMADLLFVGLAALCFFHLSVGFFFIVLLMVYNIITYFKEKNRMEPYMVSFAYIVRLINAARDVEGLKEEALEEENGRLRIGYKKLGKIRRNAWFVFSGGKFSTSSSPLELLVDYLNMVFHIDIILFNRMLSVLKDGYTEIDGMIEGIGRIDASIAVANWRKSLGEGWCRPDFGLDQMIKMKKVCHPLLTDPVDNDLELAQGRGMLLTGSNASGKSTFLRAVALNILLAQSVLTCTAECFQIPFCRLYSSISLKDSIQSGESYYMAEIKSIKRILDAVEEGGLPVICFVDEVLRGTNTVERIAASCEILRNLESGNAICFAATHDIELTGLLQEGYDNYHFEEKIVEGDVFFPYKLVEGPANSSNAIRLLGIMGYEGRIVENASRRVERFLREGSWSAVTKE